ncbi:Aprataxin-like protein [Spathaspora sp. JA1]|nr:Aprataxin-like protein [Spathaspora sp. JA1]
MSFRDAFQPYIDNPEKYNDIVLFQDENVIIIKDVYPKAIRHLLVIPRNPDVSKKHPLDAFNTNYPEYSGEELYQLIVGYVDRAKDIIIDDLSKKFNIESMAEFRNTFIKAGVHSIPSLNNLHIHVITQDFNSPRLKNKKHYNSFTTKFFVPFEQLNPLFNEKYYQLNKDQDSNYDSDSDYNSDDEDDEDKPSFIRHVRLKSALLDILSNTPYTCPSCDLTFGNSMVKLKEHLQQEYTKKFKQFGDPNLLSPNNF